MYPKVSQRHFVDMVSGSVPQPHGWMTLVERHTTIYFRAEKLERG